MDGGITMKVLVACEESQTVCKAFRERGHEAFSCDIQECSGGHPEWHIWGNVLPVINGFASFYTMDMRLHSISEKWDLIIAHPPCTYMSNAGAARLYKVIDGETYINRSRFEKGMDAKEFFIEILNADCDRIAIENPTPSAVYRLPPCSQVVQPYEFGDPYMKRTCLWLKGLPKLIPTKYVEPVCSWVSGGSRKRDGSARENKGTVYRDSKTRSKTFQGIAEAMAEQWGTL